MNPHFNGDGKGCYFDRIIRFGQSGMNFKGIKNEILHFQRIFTEHGCSFVKTRPRYDTDRYYVHSELWLPIEVLQCLHAYSLPRHCD